MENSGYTNFVTAVPQMAQCFGADIIDLNIDVVTAHVCIAGIVTLNLGQGDDARGERRGLRRGAQRQHVRQRKGMNEGPDASDGRASQQLDSYDEQIASMRGTIDNLDAALIHILAERFKCTQLIGILKARHGAAPADPGREDRQVARLHALAEGAKLDPAFAEKLLNFIIAEVLRHHDAIARGYPRSWS
jgi:chorismate mutase